MGGVEDRIFYYRTIHNGFQVTITHIRNKNTHDTFNNLKHGHSGTPSTWLKAYDKQQTDSFAKRDISDDFNNLVKSDGLSKTTNYQKIEDQDDFVHHFVVSI